jgi:hypothetical protein
METVQTAAIVVRSEKTFRFMSIRFSAFRQYCCYSKTLTEEIGMRFISICTINPTSRLPTEAEIASMQKFIVEA